MIITKTPLRISFLGGGTDYPSWYEKHGGLVVGGAINKYSYIMARYTPKFLPYKTKIIYSQTEVVNNNLAIKHRGIRAVLDYFNMWSCGLEIVHSIDIPGQSGTGSSSAFLVGLLNSLYYLKNGYEMPPDELVEAAIHLERNVMGESVGSQDQSWATYGGVRAIEFKKDCAKVSRNIYPGEIDDLNNHTLLFYTEISRIASHIASEYYNKLSDSEYVERQMRLHHLAKLGVSALYMSDWEELGKYMSESWEIKKSLSPKVSNDFINEKYDAGIRCGAYGGKLLGAGGGGCLFFLADPVVHDVIREEIGLPEIPFKFETEGSKVILNAEGRGGIGIL